MSLGFTKEWNMSFKDGASIAQEIAYSEEKACKDANSVVDLSNPKIFLKEGLTRARLTSFISSRREEEIKDLSNSRITRKYSFSINLCKVKNNTLTVMTYIRGVS